MYRDSHAARVLVTNADDLGQSVGINRGIIKAHECGIVTSASLMVRWPAAEDAVARAREHPRLGLGLHVDLGEWAYREERWVALYEVVCLEDACAVQAEVARQLARFRELTGRDPTHLDSHQHVHRAEPVRSIVCGAGRSLGIPVRHFTAGVRYCGDFYGQGEKGSPAPEAIHVDSLVGIIQALPEGVTELACHPGYACDLDSMYASEREMELRALCHPRVWAALDRGAVGVRSFAEVEGAARLVC